MGTYSVVVPNISYELLNKQYHTLSQMLEWFTNMSDFTHGNTYCDVRLSITQDTIDDIDGALDILAAILQPIDEIMDGTYEDGGQLVTVKELIDRLTHLNGSMEVVVMDTEMDIVSIIGTVEAVCLNTWGEQVDIDSPDAQDAVVAIKI